jgi:hypothetical protein
MQKCQPLVLVLTRVLLLFSIYIYTHSTPWSLVYQVERIAFLVTFCIHVLCDDVCSKFITAPIVELNIVGPGIQHGIGIGYHFTVPLST